MPKRILIATGGTGGHVYPAMALAQQFAREQKDSKILFVGGNLSENRYFDKTAFSYRSIHCGSFSQKSPLKLLKSSCNILKGILQSRTIIREFKPDVVVGFGSFYSFPPLVAAKLLSIPYILHEANAIPGKVIRWLAPYALVTGVHFPQTLDLIKGVKYEVGMPLRNAFTRKNIISCNANEYFGLFENRTTLLVFGGSQGAQTINQQVAEALKYLNQSETLQVIHIAGDNHQMHVLKDKYEALGIHACVKSFEDQMDLAWQMADVVVCRAGASSIAEQLEFEVPGILIPFPRAADDHQNHNADFLVNTVGGAVKIQEKDLQPDLLASLITACLNNAEKMKLAMHRYKETARTRDLYALINETVQG